VSLYFSGREADYHILSHTSGYGLIYVVPEIPWEMGNLDDSYLLKSYITNAFRYGSLVPRNSYVLKFISLNLHLYLSQPTF
jgi:hypothetical protein